MIERWVVGIGIRYIIIILLIEDMREGREGKIRKMRILIISSIPIIRDIVIIGLIIINLIGG